jgi:hypothetical protein
LLHADRPVLHSCHNRYLASAPGVGITRFRGWSFQHTVLCEADPKDISNAATTGNEDTARRRLQVRGRVEPEARIDVNDVARRVAYMARVSLGANAQLMTVMVIQMPHFGRG